MSEGGYMVRVVAEIPPSKAHPEGRTLEFTMRSVPKHLFRSHHESGREIKAPMLLMNQVRMRLLVKELLAQLRLYNHGS